jgi:hypothetical protein
MNRLISLALGALMLGLVLPTQAQQATTSTTPPAGSTRTFAQQLRNIVGFLTVIYRDGADRKGISGTCFFVAYQDERLGKDKAFGYLVTNRHMAEPGVEKGEHYVVEQFLLRLNLKVPVGDVQSAERPIPMNDDVHWFYPEDDSVDLAVLPFTLDINEVDYQTLSSNDLATDDKIKSLAVDAGDSVEFVGYFYQFQGHTRIEPIVRQGVLAMIPNEKIATTLQQKPGRLFLADVHAFHGNSGSPILVNVGGLRNGGLQMGANYLLLGIISGYYPEDTTFNIPAARVLTGEVHDNSGIATVVPADELFKLLNSPAMRSFRDAHVPQAAQHP